MKETELAGKALQHFLAKRIKDAEFLKKKLARAEVWKKRYDKLTDPAVEAQIRSRVSKVFELAKNEGIDTLQVDPYGRIVALYKKGDVTLDLDGYMLVSPSGVASIDFRVLNKHYAPPAFRISVGKTERIHNNVLQVLLMPNTR